MYTTVNALMGLWRHLIAARMDFVENTSAVQSLLAKVAAHGTEAVLNPAFWKRLVGYVLVQPEGDILPVRANYADQGSDRPQIGVNPCWSDRPLWYPIADAVVSTLLTGKPPKVLRAITLKPIGVQAGLKPLRFRDTIEIEPARQDFFRTVIEERKAAAHRRELSEEERKRLDTGLKTIGNATGYGIFAEMVQKRGDPAQKAW
jgi:hypothetical protein